MLLVKEVAEAWQLARGEGLASFIAAAKATQSKFILITDPAIRRQLAAAGALEGWKDNAKLLVMRLSHVLLLPLMLPADHSRMIMPPQWGRRNSLGDESCGEEENGEEEPAAAAASGPQTPLQGLAGQSRREASERLQRLQRMPAAAPWRQHPMALRRPFRRRSDEEPEFDRIKRRRGLETSVATGGSGSFGEQEDEFEKAQQDGEEEEEEDAEGEEKEDGEDTREDRRSTKQSLLDGDPTSDASKQLMDGIQAIAIDRR